MIVYLDKFSVITNTLQVRMVCRDFTIFLPKRTNFQTHRRQNLTRVRASLASDNTQIVIEWCKYSRIVTNSDD